MVSWKRDELDFTSFVELLHTDEILLVELSGVQWEESLAILGKGLEPSSLLWIDNLVILEFNEHCTI